MGDLEKAAKPAYSEHVGAMSYGVYRTLKHAVNENLVEDKGKCMGARCGQTN